MITVAFIAVKYVIFCLRLKYKTLTNTANFSIFLFLRNDYLTVSKRMTFN